MAITHALVEEGTNKVLKYADAAKEFRNGSPPDLSGTGKGVKWLPYSEDASPTYDDTTHIRDTSVEVVTGTDVTLTHPVRVMTAQESSDNKVERIQRLEGALIRIVEDLMVAIATGQPLQRSSFPEVIWNKINRHRALRGQGNI
jgi:hypothetical protein